MALTILSAGALIQEVLSGDKDLMEVCTKVFPVVAEDEAKLPYICYRRASIQQTNTKSAGAHQGIYEVQVYAQTYAQGIAIAEMVKKLLDHKSVTYQDEDEEKLTARSITLVEASEEWVGDAYMQNLSFNIKID